MPVTPDYTLLSTYCPTLPAWAALLDDSAGTPTVASAGVAGPSTPVLAAINDNASVLDNVGRHGGGIFAVLAGLELSVSSGLTLAISAGRVGIDSGHYVAATTKVMTDGGGSNLYNYVWISSTGSVPTPPTSSTASSPAAAPAGTNLFLGRVTTLGGAITAIDYSRRLTLIGGVARCRTADTSCPTDSPSSKLRFEQQTLSGLYFWDGVQWWRRWEYAALQKSTIASTERVCIPSGYQAQYARRLTVRGAVQVRGLLRVR